MLFLVTIHQVIRVRHGRDRIIVGITTTYAVSAYHHRRCEFESHVYVWWTNLHDKTRFSFILNSQVITILFQKIMCEDSKCKTVLKYTSDCQSYIENCLKICYFAAVQDPPMFLSHIHMHTQRKGEKQKGKSVRGVPNFNITCIKQTHCTTMNY
jgi:hypothetical protein